MICHSKRLKSAVVSLLLVFGLLCNPFLLTANAITADSVATYPYSYSIENILSDFQYFVQGDLAVSNHTVGAVASGGTTSISNFGDGAITSSYFEKITAVGNYDGTTMNHYKELGDKGFPAYYKTASCDTSNLTKYAGPSDYIDFDNAFTSLSNGSKALTGGSDVYTVTEADISFGAEWMTPRPKILNLAFKDSNNNDCKKVIIPKQIYNEISFINLSGVSSINDFSSEYVISITGVDTVSINFGQDPNNAPTAGTKGILFNSQTFTNGNSLKNMSGCAEAGQMYTNGMKLIWNFPDAATLTSEYTAGHIVAPGADVTIKSGTGNFEGGIIAKSVNNQSAEGHFFPYTKIGGARDITPTPPTPTTIDPIKLIKTDGTNALSGAAFGLYSNASCSTKLASAVTAIDTDSASPTYNKAVVSFVSGQNGLALSKATTYYLKETSAPAGYTVSTNIYDCIVDSNGKVTYKIDGSADAAKSDFPVCVNTKTSEPTPTAIDPIKLIKTDGTNALTGATFGLYSDASCSTKLASAVTAIDTDSASPTYNKVVVSFVSGQNGLALSKATTYYLKETSAPTGYTVSTNIYDCIVDSNGKVTYKIDGSADAAKSDFPVCVNTKTSEPTPTAIDPIKLIKTDGTNALTGATFGLYSDASCSTKLASATTAIDADSASPAYNKAVVSFVSGQNGLTLLKATTYYLKEISAPTGYTASSNVYDCIVDSNGKVTYKIDGSAVAADFPICVNTKTNIPTPTPAPTPTPTPTPAPTPTSSNGVVIDSKTGKVVQQIPTEVTAGADSTKTVSVKSQDAILFKQPDGTRSSLNDNSKLSFSSSDTVNTSNGNIEIKNLKNGTDKRITVSYNLGNGQNIFIGTIEVKVSPNGDVSVISQLIDPYGAVTDATTGKVIHGTDLTLYYANTQRNIASGKAPNTVVKLSLINGFKPNNNINPQVSDVNGTYGFMVFPNADYYIVATKGGYEKYVSSTISVGQNIVKFDVKMNRPSNKNAANHGNSTNRYKVLPQTGSFIDTTVLICFGMILILLGIIYKFRKRLLVK